MKIFNKTLLKYQNYSRNLKEINIIHIDFNFVI